MKQLICAAALLFSTGVLAEDAFEFSEADALLVCDTAKKALDEVYKNSPTKYFAACKENHRIAFDAAGPRRQELLAFGVDALDAEAQRCDDLAIPPLVDWIQVHACYTFGIRDARTIIIDDYVMKHNDPNGPRRTWVELEQCKDAKLSIQELAGCLDRAAGN